MLLPLFGAPNYLLTPSSIDRFRHIKIQPKTIDLEIGLFVAKRDQIIYSTFAKSSVMSPIVIITIGW